jgi:phosphoglycolate phosphatase-like HAD superfamily hydrolase
MDITNENLSVFARHLEECYADALQKGVTRISPLPGVTELVKELAEMEDLYQGVVTGNLEVTGRLKLEAAGLRPYLSLGAYADDSHDRTDLPGIAKERWERTIGSAIESSCCVIVGDTPKDIEAARTNHMKCLLVGTGRYPVDELELLGPDACLSDFTDTKYALETLLGLP